MAETMAYPPIEPTAFDLIVVGTGVPESVIAAAASAAGKTVLHLDPNPFYGSHFSSLPLHDLSSFLTSNSQNHIPNPHRPTSDVSDDSDSSSIINLSTRPLYSIIKISEPLEDHQSRKCNVDLAGPRVLFCADSAVDLMLKSNASQYMEFKNVDASLIWEENGKLRSVPDSRSAIFKDKTLAWSEKNQLMSFFKLVQGHFEAVGSAESSETISKEDLESPFAAFLNKIRLSPKIKSIILYAIAMADYDQDAEVCKDVLKTKDGINRLVLHHSSIGRFPNALGALIYPIYGQGELPQAFCRRAAVKGCLYVLRMPVVALLVDKGSGSYKGVKLASGQELFSQKLVLEPSITVSSPMADSSFQDSSLVFGLRDVKGKVARGICITKTPVKPDVLSCLVFFPPKSLYPGQVASIRVLQLASSLAVCPSGMYVFYISALCEDAIQGEELLNAAVNALFLVPIFGSSESISTEKSENSEEVEPTLLWNAMYVHEMTMGSFGSVSSTPMPDVNLNYNDVLHATAELFQKMYPGEEFFPETTPSDKPEADGWIIDTEESL